MNLQGLFTPEFIILLEAMLIGGVLLFLWVNRHFTHGIYLWLLAILFFKHDKIFFSDTILPDVSIGRVLFIFLIAMFIIRILTRKQNIFSFTKVEYSMILFIFLAVISMICTGFFVKDDGGLRMAQLLAGYIFPFSMFFISQHIYDTPEKRAGFIKFILLIGLYLSLTAIFEHFGLDRLVWPRYILDPYIGIHTERARGPFVQAAVNGTALGFVLSASFYFLLNFKGRTAWRIFSYALIVLTPLAIFFTYTRAAWLAAFLSFAIIVMISLRYKKRWFTIMAAIMSILIFLSFWMLIIDEGAISLASDRARSENPIYIRLDLYAASINMFFHNPLFGVGFGRFRDHAPSYFINMDILPSRSSILTEHDTFMGVLAETGIVGFMLILIIYTFVLIKSIRLYRYLSHDLTASSMVITFWGIASVFVLNSMFIEMRDFDFVNSIFFIFAGIICGWERTCNQRVGEVHNV